MNPFDEIGKEPEWSDADKAHFEKLDKLIYRTFEQNESGKELLEYWTEHLLMAGIDQTDNQLTIGMKEGTKLFIRNIIRTVRKIKDER